ncbi:MAG: riboflavin kinase, partial [Deltaproteobacteria bacterium]|nr:riboflavin kinase [Deltaproteobacteria bacterium]
DVAAASVLLARPFVYRSRVVRGDQRGRLLGYPTANLFSNEQVVPKNGIYAARVKVLGAEYQAAVSIGTRPTFDGQGVKIEAHLLDFSGPQLYGEMIEVAFVERIRDELKFSGVQELCVHIEQDIATTRRILAGPLQ